MAAFLGCIADDYTGAADLASMLVRSGLRTVQWFGHSLPPAGMEADAVVVALKTRSAAVEDAVAQSLEALRSLQRLGTRRFFFKYCSTFDSTESGNIGPVAEALMAALGTEQVPFCPAFPENGRTVYLGHLFVGSKLLNESGMEHHPRTPMTDPNIVRVLEQQSKHSVGLVPYHVVARGPAAIRECATAWRELNARLLICDTVCNQHLHDIAKAVADWPLATGSSAMGYWMAEAYREAGLPRAERYAPNLPEVRGPAAILAGSCSAATRRQVEAFKRRSPALALEPRSVLSGAAARAALDWATNRLKAGAVLIYSTMPPNELREVQQRFGETAAARAYEDCMGEIARGLVDAGVRRLVIAGGETAGAVIRSLGVRGLSIGPEIEPGVPWATSIDSQPMALALKSGNFGSDDFFSKALEMLP
jgi:uncharacterized protein YgbK (DUF1537 family)